MVKSLLQPWATKHHTTVRVTPISSSTFTTQTDTAIASGTLPNVMVTSQGYPDIYALDHLAVDISKVDPSLARYIKANEPALLAAGNTVYKGQVYGALEDAAPAMSFVNTKVFTSLHLPAPSTWSALDTKILPSLAAHHLDFEGPGDSEWYWYAALYSYGGQVYSPGGNKVAMASPAGQKAVQAYLAPYVKLHMPKSYGPPQTMADLFAKGKYPLVITGESFIANLAVLPHFTTADWKLYPYPGGPKGHYDWTGGTSVMAFNHGSSVNAEEASLLGYFWSRPVQEKMSEGFYKKANVLYTSANLSSWRHLSLPGLTSSDISSLRSAIKQSVGVQSKTKVTKAQILGLGNSWQKIQNDFDKMVLPHASLKSAPALLTKAASTLQSAIGAAAK